jgi:hypothetical protein
MDVFVMSILKIRDFAANMLILLYTDRSLVNIVWRMWIMREVGKKFRDD